MSLSPEKLLLAVDRTSSELLWAVSQLSEQAADPYLRQRSAEMLQIVISGLRHNHRQLLKPKEHSNVTKC